MIHFGIIGAGRIAKRFAASLAHEAGAELLAISGRNPEKMEAFAQTFSCGRIYLSHDELIGDPEIDAVYVALPNAFHKEFVCKALRAGKAVLCEKPAAVDAAQMAEMTACARECGVLFMEAMKVRFTPCYRRVREMVRGGALGEIRRIEIRHGVIVSEGDGPRHDPASGGVIRDLGIYAVSWPADLLDGELRVVRAHTELVRGCDMYAEADFLAESGAEVSITVAYDRKIPSEVRIEGSEGVLEIRNMHRPDAMTLTRPGGEREACGIPYEIDDFYGEVHHFCELLRAGKTQSEIMSLADSERTAALMDAMREPGPGDGRI